MIHDLDEDISFDSFVGKCALTPIVARDRIPKPEAQLQLQDAGLYRALHCRTSESPMTALDKSLRPSMSFHGKARIAYVATNSLLIMIGYFAMAGEDVSSMSDQDRVTRGVGVYMWPLLSLFMTGLVVAAVYVMRGLWLMGAWIFRRVV